MPCLVALFGLVAPRLALLFLWLFTPLTERAFNTWIFPLLGVIFLPYTTLFYCLVAAPLGPTHFWGWMIVVIGFLLDLRGGLDARDGYENRESIRNLTPGLTDRPVQ
jgi:hypothetical protein